MLTRAVPVVVLASAAFTAGIVLASRSGEDERALVTSYVHEWSHTDYAGMYHLLDGRSRARVSEGAFARQVRDAAETATLTSVSLERIGSGHNNTIPVAMRIRTRLWGLLRQTLEVTLRDSGSGPRIVLTRALLFPGLRGGERLRRVITLPPRASILASDGTPLAEGPGRTTPIPDVAGEVVGTLGPPPADLVAQYRALGYPTGAQVGLDGLERIFQSRLAGTLGGTLMAGGRTLASRRPVSGAAVQTTISPAMERDAVAALAGQYGGLVVMNPRTGALEALAGIAFSDVQPPGSTMKIVTATAALSAHLVTLATEFPVQSSTTISGFTMQNANGEACGGTLLNAFAVSCNSVFAPLGVQVGAKRLVATAERFGFDQAPSILGAAESTIPSATTIGDDLAVGSSAIGQGLVQATPLEMTDVAATVAMGGRRPIPTLLAHQRPRFVRVMSPRVAGEVRQMMEAVVSFGTGTSAQIPGVVVAGKTGTAELRTTVATPNDPSANNPKNTDAWFVAFAPAGRPRVAAGALFPNQGAGATTAAPPVRAVLVSALAH